jgi:hypothetical protein
MKDQGGPELRLFGKPREQREQVPQPTLLGGDTILATLKPSLNFIDGFLCAYQTNLQLGRGGRFSDVQGTIPQQAVSNVDMGATVAKLKFGLMKK